MSSLEKQARDLSKMFRETADKLDEHFDNVKVARVTASSLAVAGGIATVAGLCLAPFTAGASLAVGAAGSALAASGGATASGAEIVGMIIEKTKYSQMNKEWKAFNGKLEVVMKPGLTTKEILDKLRKLGMNAMEAAQFAKKITSLYKTLPKGASKTQIRNAIGLQTKALALIGLGVNVYDLITVSIDIAKKTKSPVGLLLRRLADDLDDMFKD